MVWCSNKLYFLWSRTKVNSSLDISKIFENNNYLVNHTDINSNDVHFFSYFSYDFLYVYDGTSRYDSRELAAMTGTFAGNELTALTTISTGSSMLLNFQSDPSESKGGFVLQYETGKNTQILNIDLCLSN